MSETNYECILQFDDQSPSFVYGFEAGQVWKAMQAGEFLDMHVHGENMELFQRMATRHGYKLNFEAEEGTEDWFHLTGEILK